jgi:antirestriction protein ArdC
MPERKRRRTHAPRSAGEDHPSQEERLQELYGQMTEGVQRIASGDGWKSMLQMAAKLHNYSFYNQVLLAMQKEDVTHVASFNTWKKVGRSVRKGEKALYVLGPMKYASTEKDKDTGQAEKVVRIRGFRPQAVFDISQTDGPELPKPQTLAGEPPAALRAGLTRLLEQAGYQVKFTTIPGQAKGDTSPDGVVRIDFRQSPMEQIAVMVHELSHVKHGHIEDISEYRNHRGRFETEAESTAFLVLSDMGVDVGEWSFDYITSWSRGDVELLRQVADKVVRTSQGILNELRPNGLTPELEARAGDLESAERPSLALIRGGLS